MKRLTTIAATAIALGMSAPALSASVTFGQFLQKDASARLFRYQNQDAGAVKGAKIYTTAATAGTNANVAGAIPIYFVLSNAGLPADLLGFQDAHLAVNFVSSAGTTGTGVTRRQAFDTVTSGSITITRDTAALEGIGSRTNLLTVSFTNASLDAAQSAGAFTFSTSADSTISYSSDFLDFSHTTMRDFSFSFSGASPTFQAALGSSSRNTRFSGTGTFASDPAPLTFGVPEASTWAMLVVGFGAVGATMRTGRRRRDLFAV